jgi:DNA-binding MarR family transcriptional regulator
VATADPSRAELVDEAWQLLASFLFKMGGRHMMTTARATGLNPGAIKALHSLDLADPQPMRSLADSWGCDASNVTWLVDRLEERGLVERRTLPTDRRVRTVVLTPAGVAMKETIEQAWSEPPPQLERLSVDELATLAEILRKLTP